MKKLVIILVIVGVSFLALLVYGVGRSEQSGRPTERDCSTPPTGDDLDEDDFEDWCPPEWAENTRPFQRFAADLDIDPVEIRNSGLGAGQFEVATSDKRGRSAKITLVAGSTAILRGDPNGDGDDSKLCLCRASVKLADTFDSTKCPKQWISIHFDPALGRIGECRAGDDKGQLPFLKEGGKILLEAGPEARVRVE